MTFDNHSAFSVAKYTDRSKWFLLWLTIFILGEAVPIETFYIENDIYWAIIL